MSIPDGTKFHGVAPEVPTDNLGSATMNAKRNVYTYPDDFNSGGGGLYSYTGAIINFAKGSTAPFNGDTVEWGGISSPTSQTAVLVFPETVEITHFFCKLLSVGTTSGGFDYQFNLYRSALLANGDPNQAGTWTTVSTGMGGSGFFDDGAAAWGLQSGDVTGTGLVCPANEMIAIGGILNSGSVSETNIEAIYGIVAKPFTP